MDFMELSRDTTRFRKELQYLSGQGGSVHTQLRPHGGACPRADATLRGSHSHTCGFRDLLNPTGPTPGSQSTSLQSSRLLHWGLWGAAETLCPLLDSPSSPEPAPVTLPGGTAPNPCPPLDTRTPSRYLHSDHK